MKQIKLSVWSSRCFTVVKSNSNAVKDVEIVLYEKQVFGFEYFTNRCHVQFQLEEGTNEDLLRSVRGIKRAFRKITSYTLPYPGPTIAGASENKKEWRLTG